MSEYKLGEIETIFADIIWDNGPVTSRRLTELAEETFHGSLPAFSAAFVSRKKLSDSEIDELQKVIDAVRG